MAPQYDEGLQVVPSGDLEVFEAPNHPIPWNHEKTGLEVGAGGVDKSGMDKIAVENGERRGTICGIRKRTFWIVVAIVSVLIVAAVVGGAVGATRSNLSTNSATGSTASTIGSSTVSATTASTTSSTASSTSSAASATTTATLARNCSSSINGTTYTSYFNNGFNGQASTNAGLVFKELCSMVTDDGINLAESPMSTFEQCIELCASWNFWHGSTDCQAVDYKEANGYCWLLTNVTHFRAVTGTDAAAFDRIATPAEITIADPNVISNPISNCNDGSNYTSRFTDGADGTANPSAGLKFQMHCNADTSAYVNLAQVYLSSFTACIELCASINFWSSSSICYAATYSHTSSSCWVKSSGSSNATKYTTREHLATLIS